MNKLKNILNKYNLKINSLKYIGKVIIINTNKGIYVYKEINNNKIYEYLETRGFNYFKKPINNKNDNYEIIEFINNKNIPKEKKINDLVNIIGILHKKTVFEKEIDLNDLKKIYENMQDSANYLMNYYSDINNIIDNTIFMSPLEYLLVRNIDIIYYLISFIKVESLNWFNEVKDKRIIRYNLIHNNISTDHLLESDLPYLISWDKSCIDLFYLDLKKIIEDNYNDIDIFNVIKEYQKVNKLSENEYRFLLLNLAMINKININDNSYIDTYNLSNYLEYLRKIVVLVQKNDKKNNII